MHEMTAGGQPEQSAFDALYGRARPASHPWLWRIAAVNCVLLVMSLVTVAQRNASTVKPIGSYEGSYAGRAAPGVGAHTSMSMESALPGGHHLFAMKMTGEVTFGKDMHLSGEIEVPEFSSGGSYPALKKQSIELWAVGSQVWMRAPGLFPGQLVTVPSPNSSNRSFNPKPPKFGTSSTFTKRGTETRNGIAVDHWSAATETPASLQAQAPEATSSGTQDYWVGTADGYVREIETRAEFSVGGKPELSGSVKMSMQVFDIGAAVHIVKPAGTEAALTIAQIQAKPPGSVGARVKTQGQIVALQQIAGLVGGLAQL